MFQFPFGTMHQLNLDWFLGEWENYKQEWADAQAGIDNALQGEIDRVEDAMTDLYDARDAAVQAKEDAEDAADSVVSDAAQCGVDALKAEGYAVGEQDGIPVGSGSPYYQQNAKYYKVEAGTYRYLSEAYAKGEMGGSPVAPGEAGYQDNAKYYKDAAKQDKDDTDLLKAAANAAALRAEGWANGEQNGSPVTSGSPYYEDNAKYYKEQAETIVSNIPTLINSFEYVRKDITTECEIVKGDVSGSGISDDPSTKFCRVKIPVRYINDKNILEIRKTKDKGKYSIYVENQDNTFNGYNVIEPFICRSNEMVLLSSDYLNYYLRVGDYYHQNINFTVDKVYDNLQFNIVEIKPSDKKIPAGTQLKNKSVVYFGDSIVGGRYNPQNFLMNTASTNTLATGFSFGDLLHEQLGDLIGWNCSVPGGKVTDTSAVGTALMPYVMNNEIKKTIDDNYRTVDAIIILAGTNDFGANVNLATFVTSYQNLIGMVPSGVKVICCSPTHRTDKTVNTNGDTLEDFADAIEQIAPYYIDLYSLTNNADFDAHLTDGLHPDMVGHSMIADLIIKNCPSLT